MGLQIFLSGFLLTMLCDLYFVILFPCLDFVMYGVLLKFIWDCKNFKTYVKFEIRVMQYNRCLTLQK